MPHKHAILLGWCDVCLIKFDDFGANQLDYV